MLRVCFITIHPDTVQSYCDIGIFSRAHKKGLAEVSVINLRDFGVDRQGSVDDKPYGGGEGMIMRPEPIAAALKSFKNPLVIAPSPKGQIWDQKKAENFAQYCGPEQQPCKKEVFNRPLVFICGRFSGIDQRVLDAYVDYEFSLGDFVIAGGELAALTMCESILRLVPGVLGDDLSAVQDSFASGMDYGLEHPLYTRPEKFEGMSVPKELMCGDPKVIDKWRKDQRQKLTENLRPDLFF